MTKLRHDGLYASVREFIACRMAVDLALYNVHEIEAQKLPEYSRQGI